MADMEDANRAIILVSIAERASRGGAQSDNGTLKDLSA